MEWIVWAFALPFCSLAICLLFFLVSVRQRRASGTVAFFHPYCDAGGGGERVLWCAINAMHKRFKRENIRYVVYTGDRSDAAVILEKAKARFNVSVASDHLSFVFLRSRFLLEASNYPHFTLLLQMLASLVVGVEALCKFSPQVFIDSMGYPLTLPLFRWVAGSKVASYVHYPTISSEMLMRVESGESAFNNAEWIATSAALSSAKLLYYRLFAFLYRLCGLCSHIVMVNGSWTKNHIIQLWGVPERTFLVFPPCNVDHFLRLTPKSEDVLVEKKLVQLLSIGQIRPEKDHRLQLNIMARLKEVLRDERPSLSARLVLCGGCRNDEDMERANDLRQYAYDLKLSDEEVVWALNAPIETLTTLLEESLIGLHTMYNEHFGISVVEGVAAGQIMVAHNSGGPKLDILRNWDGDNRVGLLASTVDEYVECIMELLRMGKDGREAIRKNGRRAMSRFSEAQFELSWNAAVTPLFSS